MKENSIKKEQSSIEEDIERLKLCSTNQCHICGRYEKEECILERNRCEQHILSDYKRVLEMNEVLLKENEKLKKDYYNVINKIENKIDRFDYEFKKTKRQNNKDKSDYYWDLIINFKKLLESEENK